MLVVGGAMPADENTGEGVIERWGFGGREEAEDKRGEKMGEDFFGEGEKGIFRLYIEKRIWEWRFFGREGLPVKKEEQREVAFQTFR